MKEIDRYIKIEEKLVDIKNASYGKENNQEKLINLTNELKYKIDSISLLNLLSFISLIPSYSVFTIFGFSSSSQFVFIFTLIIPIMIELINLSNIKKNKLKNKDNKKRKYFIFEYISYTLILNILIMLSMTTQTGVFVFIYLMLSQIICVSFVFKSFFTKKRIDRNIEIFKEKGGQKLEDEKNAIAKKIIKDDESIKEVLIYSKTLNPLKHYYFSSLYRNHIEQKYEGLTKYDIAKSKIELEIKKELLINE